MICPTDATRRPTITIVDDDGAVRNSLAFALRSEGFSVRDYARAEDALSDALVVRSNCFIVDYNLPKMNGLELISELRRRDIRTPAILITTGPNALVRRGAAAAQMTIIEKPLLGDTLFNEVRAALARRGPACGNA